MKAFHVNKLIDKLLDTENINNLLGGKKVYPLIGKWMPKSQVFDLPAIVYMRQSMELSLTKDMYSLPWEVPIQIDIVTKKYEQGLSIADEVYKIFATLSSSYEIDSSLTFNNVSAKIESVQESTLTVDSYCQTFYITLRFN